MIVSPPTRPMNINVIRISFDGTESVGVIPKLKPTVARAEIASNRHGIRGRLSRMLSDHEHTGIPRLVYMKRIAIAVATISGIMRRLNISGLSFLAKTAVAQEIRTARVVVLIPPAVDPGLPPTSMRRIIRNWPDSRMEERSAVLKPAVRVVTDWNKDTRIRFPAGIS